MTNRRQAAEAFAEVAPDGLGSVSRDDVMLDVRCRCKQLLLRVVRTNSGPLAVWRHHNSPTQVQLRNKGRAWQPTQRQDPRLVRRGRRLEIEDALATQVGWWEDPIWYPTENYIPPVWPADVRCSCGLTLIWQYLKPSVDSQLKNGRSRLLPAPQPALLSRADYLDLLEERHGGKVVGRAASADPLKPKGHAAT